MNMNETNQIHVCGRKGKSAERLATMRYCQELCLKNI